MSAAPQVRAVLLLPGIVTVGMPALLLWRSGVDFAWGLPTALSALVAVLAALLVLAGLLLVARTIALFVTVGEGTLAPWDQTKRLVDRGPYRYVRNPMISGVLAILLGESLLLGSVQLLSWFAGVLAANALYIPLVEEPGLRRRFGDEYDSYRASVPRWLPRLGPWSRT